MLSNRWSIPSHQFEGQPNQYVNGGAHRIENPLTPASRRARKGQLNFWARGKSFIVEYCDTSSVHGLVFLSKVGLHIAERILWMTFICIAFVGIVSLSMRIWERYQTSPMVITMDRNKFVWNTSFPTLTLCPHRKVDDAKLEEYIVLHQDMFDAERDRAEFRHFVKTLANMTFENIDELSLNRSFGIPSSQYLDLLYELKWDFEPELNRGTLINMQGDETITEAGICFTANSILAKYTSFEYWKSNMWDVFEEPDLVVVHPLDGEIYAQVINLSTSYDVYFHGSREIPDIYKKRYSFGAFDFTTVKLEALEIFASQASRDFTVQQRKCRFPHETADLITTPIYSFGLCRSECRMNFAMKICGCIPHFYRSRVRNGKILPVCGVKELPCLAQVKGEIISLKSDTLKIDCNCPVNCEDSNFFVQSIKVRSWFLGSNLQWGINDYPKMQLRRDVLFSFADVLVYIGGLVGFFLGCSALSFTEFIYFFGIRFLRRLLGK